MDTDLVFGGDAPAAEKKTRAKRTPKAAGAGEPDEAAPKKNPKSGWPIVWIDAVDGMPNYEEVGVNGKVYQIMREIEVPVPPEVVEVLRHAIGVRIVDKHDPQGGIMRVKQQYSTIPWRLVGYVP